MQDHQVHLQYFAEEHPGNFHNPNVTTKNRVNGSKVRYLRLPEQPQTLNLMPLKDKSSAFFESKT